MIGMFLNVHTLPVIMLTVVMLRWPMMVMMLYNADDDADANCVWCHDWDMSGIPTSEGYILVSHRWLPLDTHHNAVTYLTLTLQLMKSMMKVALSAWWTRPSLLWGQHWSWGADQGICHWAGDLEPVHWPCSNVTDLVRQMVTQVPGFPLESLT